LLAYLTDQESVADWPLLMQAGLILKFVISGGGKVTVTVLSPEIAPHPPEPVASARYVVVAVGETV